MVLSRRSRRQSRVQRKAGGGGGGDGEPAAGSTGGVWDGLKQNIMLGTNLLNSRTGRAGEILNPFRGLSLRQAFPLSPFSPDTLNEDECDANGRQL